MKPIDFARVLLIDNADIAQSKLDADDYVIQRSLNPAHRMSFAFGTSNAVINVDTLKVSIIPAVAAYILAHGIQAVICSTYTPCRVNPQSLEFPVATYTLASYMAAAVFVTRSTTGNIPGQWGPPESHSTLENILSLVEQDWLAYCISTYINYRLPHGRLGCPDYANPVIAEMPLNAGGSIYTNAVATALAAEKVNPQRLPHVLTTALSYSVMTSARNALAMQQAATINMPSRLDLGLQYPASALATGATQSPLSFFGLCLADNWNALNSTNINPLPGAWGFNWTSAAGLFGSNLLKAGGAAAILTFGEPYANGMPLVGDLFAYATAYGMPLMLASYLSYYSNGMGSTVCGDPLYAPYASLPPYVDPATISGLYR